MRLLTLNIAQNQNNNNDGNCLTAALLYAQSEMSVIAVHGIVNGQCTCGRPDCDKPGKHPIGRWKEYQNRKATDEEIHTWFHQHPHANVGIVTGRISGIVVLDIDGQSGMYSLRQYAKIQMNQTPIARTGRADEKGLHVYFRYPGEISIGNKVALLPGVDIRGDGGLVVAPPSMHYSGRPYIWLA